MAIHTLMPAPAAGFQLPMALDLLGIVMFLIHLFVSMRTFPLGNSPGGSGQDEYSELGGK